MSDSDNRLMLREKIEAGKARIAERDLVADAKEAADKASGFVAEHPFALMGGALVLGLFIGSRGKKSPASKPAKTGNFLTALLAEAAIAQGLKMIDQVKDGPDRMDKN
jgi:hypothetical protein